MVLVEKLSKEENFIPVKSINKAVNIADIFMKEFFRLHGVMKVIFLDIDAMFIGNFWKSLFKGLGTVKFQYYISSTNGWAD